MRRAVGQLMDGQREALEVLPRALDEETLSEDALADLEDILQGSLTISRHRLPPTAGESGRESLRGEDHH